MADRTPFLMALASDAARRFAAHLPRVVADGGDRAARAECLVAAWLAGVVLAAGTGAAAQARPRARRPRPAACRDPRDHPSPRHPLQPGGGAGGARRASPPRSAAMPADRLAAMLRGFPIPQRLREVGFDRAKTDFVAREVAAMAISVPRKVSAEDVRTLLAAAY